MQNADSGGSDAPQATQRIVLGILVLAPHFGQKSRLSGMLSLQPGHCFVSGFPQLEQNDCPAGTSLRQWGQIICPAEALTKLPPMYISLPPEATYRSICANISPGSFCCCTVPTIEVTARGANTNQPITPAPILSDH